MSEVQQVPYIAEIAVMVHPADFWLGAPEKPLTMEEVRLLQHFAAQTPVAEEKVAIIRQADHFRPEVANALLKLLEEPPAYLKIVLLGESEVLLPTIQSRVQRLQALQRDVNPGEPTFLDQWRDLFSKLNPRDPDQRKVARRLLMYQPLLHSTIQHGVLLEGFRNPRL